MSEKEKAQADSITQAIDRLKEVKGPGFVDGLIAGIGIGTAQPAPKQ